MWGFFVLWMWYVYVIESLADGTLYKGVTSDYVKRLEEHNTGRSTYTSRKMPWKMVYLELFDDKTDALKRELMLKRQNRKYLDWLILQPSNILNA
jgi:putative endonuclease